MLLIPKPTTVQVGQGLINKIVADANAGAESLINTTLAAYSVSLQTAASTTDTGEKKFIRYAERGDVPAGLSVYLFPTSAKFAWVLAPSGIQDTLTFRIRIYWRDVAGPPAQKLTATPGKLWRMLSDAGDALTKVLGPESLGASSGGWDVTGAGDLVLNPLVGLSALSDDDNPDAPTVTKRKVEEPYVQLIWSAWKLYATP